MFALMMVFYSVFGSFSAFGSENCVNLSGSFHTEKYAAPGFKRVEKHISQTACDQVKMRTVLTSTSGKTDEVNVVLRTDGVFRKVPGEPNRYEAALFSDKLLIWNQMSILDKSGQKVMETVKKTFTVDDKGNLVYQGTTYSEQGISVAGTINQAYERD